ncbi:hypothetical protein [Desulfovibrio cuneatus]|uniref:hypothetical protein n=1 Tax=Desulfovibrio cuneatus TaxID=159728 RepID=UPI000489A19C|nr:hypothetical protein [Desulfovibrio cuneatus]
MKTTAKLRMGTLSLWGATVRLLHNSLNLLPVQIAWHAIFLATQAQGGKGQFCKQYRPTATRHFCRTTEIKKVAMR